MAPKFKFSPIDILSKFSYHKKFNRLKKIHLFRQFALYSEAVKICPCRINVFNPLIHKFKL